MGRNLAKPCPRTGIQGTYGTDRGTIVTCREFADFMADYLSGDLQRNVRQQFERHLNLCINCERYLTSYRQTITLGKRAFTDDAAALPADVPEELVRAILAVRSTRRP